MSTTTNLEPTVSADAVGTNRWYLSAAPIVRALVHLCVPMAAAMIVGAVYNVINAVFIGSLHDTALLAAITFGAPLLGLVRAIGGVFGVGVGELLQSAFLIITSLVLNNLAVAYGDGPLAAMGVAVASRRCRSSW